MLLDFYPEKVAPGRLKMMLSRLIKGIPGAADIRRDCMRTHDPFEMLELLTAHCDRFGILDMDSAGSASASDVASSLSLIRAGGLMSAIEIVRDPDVIAGFTEDASGLVGTPSGVVRPRDIEDVAEAIAYARANQILSRPPRFTSTTGAPLAMEGSASP